MARQFRRAEGLHGLHQHGQPWLQCIGALQVVVVAA